MEGTITLTLKRHGFVRSKGKKSTENATRACDAQARPGMWAMGSLVTTNKIRPPHSRRSHPIFPSKGLESSRGDRSKQEDGNHPNPRVKRTALKRAPRIGMGLGWDTEGKTQQGETDMVVPNSKETVLVRPCVKEGWILLIGFPGSPLAFWSA
jgi:hypothetical protein